MVVDGVLDALLARLEHGERAVGIVGREQARLRGHRAAEVDHDEPAAAGAFDRAEEAVVVLLVDDDVVGRVGTEAVAPDAPGAAALVERGVEDRPVVAGPGGAVRRAGDRLRMVLPGLHVADAQHVVLVALGVERPDQEAVVGAHLEGPEGAVLVPLGQHVLVDEDLLGAALLRGAPAVDRVLEPLDAAGVVEERAVGDGHRQVGLLDAAHDLGVEPLLQRPQRIHDGVGIGVLRLQVRRDVRVVPVPQPVVVVGPLVAVGLVHMRDALGDGRGRGGAGHHADTSGSLGGSGGGGR